MENRQAGQTLIEVLISIAIIGLFAAIGISPLEQARRRVALVAGTSELRATFQQTRMLAIAHDRNVALKFQESGGTWTWSVYEDRDGDGVRNDDIQRGIDKLIAKPRRFEHAPARIGLPRMPLPDPFSAGKKLDARSPVRFGTSMLCSFSRVGEATNGSMVLTDGTNAAMIRVNGGSARITVLRWDGTRWKEGD